MLCLFYLSQTPVSHILELFNQASNFFFFSPIFSSFCLFNSIFWKLYSTLPSNLSNSFKSIIILPISNGSFFFSKHLFIRSWLYFLSKVVSIEVVEKRSSFLPILHSFYSLSCGFALSALAFIFPLRHFSPVSRTQGIQLLLKVLKCPELCERGEGLSAAASLWDGQVGTQVGPQLSASFSLFSEESHGWMCTLLPPHFHWKDPLLLSDAPGDPPARPSLI